jgi:hypothetical protein
MRRFAAALMATVALTVAAPAAGALTIRDVIELTRAGLGEDVLLALIEVAGGVYAIDTATLRTLHESGVGQRVIVALVRSGRERPPLPPPPLPAAEQPAMDPPAPQVVVIETRVPEVQPVFVPVYPVFVPVYVAVPAVGHQPRRAHAPASAADASFVPFQSGASFLPPAAPRQEPVYWGFGGKLRPDAWGQPSKAPAPAPPQKD